LSHTLSHFTLTALATLAATGAFAQSSVQIDGILDAGYQAINFKGNKVNGIAGNGSSTSQLNVRGTEDLGSGLKAEFRVESDWNAVSANANTGLPSSINNKTSTNSINSNNALGALGNGEIRVGLNGGFGRVDVGSVYYNTLSTFNLGQPFGTAIGSGFRTFYINDSQGTSQVRAENAIKYVTPTFEGFNATLYKSNKQTKANSVAASATSTTNLNAQPNAFSTSLGAYDQQGTQEIGANYANGPLAASVSQIKQDWVGVQALNSSDAAVGAVTNTVTTAAAKYSFGAASVGALYQTNKTDTNSVNNKAYTISATYTVDALDLKAQVGELKNVSNVKSTLWGLGADYNLSKRTSVYFRAESIDDKAGAMNAAVTPTAVKGTDTKFSRTALGLRHAF
jgi:predicted porin